ncbi:hypothetical protein DFQ27_008385 [Actinomortierella ambigua]|uniref:Uncharacterized protein n=1 Tax=Actinomortierella ambigua TaxID=1343610 RepID=A0A9P6UBN2_9FUNG|nr:hypothetical protein DFQ27_008385 [Actinomortierella ambigua]
MSLPKEYPQWVQRADGEEHVSFEAFFERFNYNDQASATEDYLQLLESDEIRRKRRDALKASFKRFQRNHEQQFRAQRALGVLHDLNSCRLTTYRTSSGVARTSSNVARTSSGVAGREERAMNKT